MNKYSTLIIAASIIISALIVSFSDRFQPSPINESFVIDSWTGDIYDIQGNNLTDIHKNIPTQELNTPDKTDKIQ
jgi:hypothetical protein|tara:strand:+ start:503 stop:727 length:225 start_codon:yes stop_codon:yes gene_type:complete